MSFSSRVKNLYLKKKKFKSPSRDAIDSFLKEQDHPWYRSLSEEGQESFQLRCRKFLQDMRFIQEGDRELTERTKIRIASAFVLVSWGLKNYYFPSVHTLRVGESVSNVREDCEQGERRLTHPEVLDEKVARGTEALFFEIGLILYPILDAQGEFQERFSIYIENWKKEKNDTPDPFDQEMKELLKGREEEDHELYFALCLERFFAAPEGLKEKASHVFHFCSFILVIDPFGKDLRFNKSSRKRIKKEEGRVPDPERAGVPPAERPDNSWMYFLAAGLLAGTVGNLILHSYTLIDWSTHLLILLGLAGIVAYIQYDALVREQEVMNRAIFSIYCLLGPANLILAIMLSLNFFLPITDNEQLLPIEKEGHIRQGKYTVVEFPKKYERFNNDGRIVVFLGDYYYSRKKQPNGVELRIGWGIFGMPTVQKRIPIHRQKFASE